MRLAVKGVCGSLASGRKTSSSSARSAASSRTFSSDAADEPDTERCAEGDGEAIGALPRRLFSSTLAPPPGMGPSPSRLGAAPRIALDVGENAELLYVNGGLASGAGFEDEYETDAARRVCVPCAGREDDGGETGESGDSGDDTAGLAGGGVLIASSNSRTRLLTL